MPTMQEADTQFLANKRIAVTGVSRTAKNHGANTVFNRLRDRGYDVFAVNPNADRVEGVPSYHNLKSIPGGVEVIPLPPKKPHPGDPKNASSPADFAPDQHLTLWPYFDFKDPRWKFGSKYITLRQDASKGPTKIGLAHRQGWVGYLNGGTLFVKRVGYEEDKPYPDGGCNFETFSNQDMLECETLGPIVKLAPGRGIPAVKLATTILSPVATNEKHAVVLNTLLFWSVQLTN